MSQFWKIHNSVKNDHNYIKFWYNVYFHEYFVNILTFLKKKILSLCEGDSDFVIFLNFWSSAKENYHILYTFLKCILYIFVIYVIRSFFWVVIHIFKISGSKVIDILINGGNRRKKSLILMKKCWYQQNFAKFWILILFS